MAQQLRVLELFAGIGGCAAAIGGKAEVVSAVDSDQEAISVYRHNFANATIDQPVESLTTKWFRDCAADVWWMSPPVLPYVHAGLRREIDDARAKGLLHILKQIENVKPRYIAMESVPAFDKSLARQLLLETLAESDYEWQETQLCPTELGIPNQRRRYYLVASRDAVQAWKPLNEALQFPLSATLDETTADDLVIAPELLAMHRGVMHVVDANDSCSVSSCFTSDYGRSVNKTGSYLLTAGRVRHFAPTEMLRQLGFPPSFSLPEGTSRPVGWRLVGSSLSIPAVRYILDALPGLMTRRSRVVSVAAKKV
ncbi:MAG TPA: DNA cytosine methyltransferase [Pirellulaceae bacterium]|nr:DNA cytosine methyltransferase [Pirellulaceae bacterium]